MSRFRKRDRCHGCWPIFALLSALSLPAWGRVASELYVHGYAVLPEPQQVTLSGKDIRFGAGWSLSLSGQVTMTDTAVKSLTQELGSRYHLTLSESPAGFCTNWARRGS